MKKSIFYGLFLLCLSVAYVPSLSSWDGFTGLSVEARVAYYLPSSGKVKRIYGDVWKSYQLEVALPIDCNWSVWGGVNGTWKYGRSIGFNDRTKIAMIPFFVGAKYFLPIGCNTKLFVGGALAYSLLRVRDYSPYVREHTNVGAFGGILQSGIRYYATCNFFVDAFADYLFQHFHPHHHVSYSDYVETHGVNMSGWNLGVGFGWQF